MNDVEVYLYDAKGHDEQLELDDVDIGQINDKHLLWVNILTRDEELLASTVAKLDLTDVPCKEVIDDCGPLVINRFETFFRFCINTVITNKNASPEKLMIDFIVGKNFVVTIHEGDVDYFAEFREREKGETQFGELDAESFVATLLDLNIVSYFLALEQLEREVDEIDEKVLTKDFETDIFLKEMVRLRRDASKLRRWLLPHREVFYALARPDFRQIAESQSFEHYKMLNQHFERAVEAIEHSRETVLSIFELFATKSAQETNNLIRKLTLFTLIVGSLGVIAGIFGMNYQLSYFEDESGFWFTVGAMAVIALSWGTIAKVKGWL